MSRVVKEVVIDVLVWFFLMSVTASALVGFSLVVSRMLSKMETSHCGLVRVSDGQCLDGRYEVQR